LSSRLFRADLHVHSCLSPCADLELSPRNIVERSLQVGLDIIAISDHNTAENVDAVKRAAVDTSLVVIPAMEISSLEEVHVLSLFPDLDAAREVQDIVYQHSSRSQDSNYVQEQVIVNEHDEVEGFCPYMLIGATTLSLRQTVDLIHLSGGVALAAHIDRQAFGVIGQLGFIPPRVHFDALEVSSKCPLGECGQRFPEYSHHTFVTGSDTHFLHDLGSVWTPVCLLEPSFEELCKALRHEGGRSVWVDAGTGTGIATRVGREMG
jgi:PHP family Zn ribbon phosphoesterase